MGRGRHGDTRQITSKTTQCGSSSKSDSGVRSSSRVAAAAEAAEAVSVATTAARSSLSTLSIALCAEGEHEARQFG